MNEAHVAIIGGGLSGLYAAYLLEQSGITNYILFEAKDSLGGRLSSPSAADEHVQFNEQLKHFDLGGTWYWPKIQTRLDAVIKRFGLQVYPQHEVGEMLIDRADLGRPIRVNGYASYPPMMRVSGGMHALINAIKQAIQPAKVLTDHTVTGVEYSSNKVCITANGTQWIADHILLAIPPRLAASTIDFSPHLPEETYQAWMGVNTWMATHAKYLAIYDEPFWKTDHLSGDARSDYGPLGEIHDASSDIGVPALFGFFELPASVRSTFPESELKERCRKQLKRLFGPEAANPKFDFIKDWSADKYTSTLSDLDQMGAHPIPPPCIASEPWRQRLIGIATEWSTQYPGYIAGAVDASFNGVKQLLQQKLDKAES